MVRIALLYSLFAALSIAVNIATQVLVVATVQSWAVPASILAGTATGLVTKYVLDKRWIFWHVSSSGMHEAGTFLLYAAMGVVTTLVFWGTELLFHSLFDSDAMRYLGGVIGLVIGYTAKYRLDSRFVFRTRPQTEQALPDRGA